MYKSTFTGQWEDCPLDKEADCKRSNCEGCPSNESPSDDDYSDTIEPFGAHH